MLSNFPEHLRLGSESARVDPRVAQSSFRLPADDSVSSGGEMALLGLEKRVISRLPSGAQREYRIFL